jgi:hypothetical protein
MNQPREDDTEEEEETEKEKEKEKEKEEEEEEERMSVAEFTKIVLDTMDRPPVHRNPFLPDATVCLNTSDDMDQQFTKEMELLVLFVNVEPSFFETLRRATELFQLMHQKLTHVYSARPQKWYPFVVIVYKKAHEFLETLQDATHIPIIMDKDDDMITNKHKNIVTNFVQCLLNMAPVVEPILIRNNYFDEMQVDDNDELI